MNIAWFGFFLAIIVLVAIIVAFVIIAAFLGIHEFIRIRHLSDEIETQIKGVETCVKEITDLKTQVELDFQKLHEQLVRDSQTFIEVAHNISIATNAYKVGDNVNAIDYYLQILSAQPENLLVMERLGRAYSNLNDIDKASYYLNKALAINSSYVPALRSLALCYRYINKDKAIGYFQQALRIEPHDHETWDFLGLIYRDNGQIDEAIFAHKQALDLKSRPETLFYLSILYALNGDKEGARTMSLNARYDLKQKEHDERIRPVWKDLIRAGVHIIEGDENEAYKLVESLSRYITTQRLYDGVTGHLTFLLESTGHEAWRPKFISVFKVK